MAKQCISAIWLRDLCFKEKETKCICQKRRGISIFNKKVEYLSNGGGISATGAG